MKAATSYMKDITTRLSASQTPGLKIKTILLLSVICLMGIVTLNVGIRNTSVQQLKWPFGSRQEPRVIRNIREPLNKSILLYARFRSGSTYTSEFFHQHHSFFYIFEPLQFVHFNQVFENGTDIVRTFLNCDFSSIQMPALIQGQGTWWRERFCHNAGYPFCKAFTLPVAQNACKKSSFIAAKVILFRKIQYLQPLVDQGSRVIMLIRDPRGLINSYRLTLGPRYPNGRGYEFNDANWYCNNMLRDLEYIHSSNADSSSYHIVRYEDLAVQPINSAHTLYDYVGIPPDDSLLQWAKGVEKGHKNSREAALDVVRNNATDAAQRWRKTMDIDVVLQIQDACDQFMDVFGYTKISTIKQLLDYNEFLTEPRDLRTLIDP